MTTGLFENALLTGGILIRRLFAFGSENILKMELLEIDDLTTII